MPVQYGGDKITFSDGSNLGSGWTGMKNRLINGSMMIDQRNAGASVTQSGTTYGVDRWSAETSVNSKFTVQQNASSVTPPSGFKNYLGITVTSAYSVTSTDFFLINQYVEGYNIADLGWGTANAQTVTLSFWVRSSLTGTFGGVLNNTSNNYSYPFTYTISSANTWEQKTITVAGPTSGTWDTTNGRGICVRFGLGVGSTYSTTAGAWSSTSNIFGATGATSVVATNGATWYITGVQLEKGSTATSFDYRPYGTELALCQRYYFSTFASQGATPSNNTCAATLSGNLTECIGARTPTTMRANPTYTIWNAATGASGTIRISGANKAVSSLSGETPDGFAIMVLSSAGDNAGIGSYSFTASAEL